MDIKEAPRSKTQNASKMEAKEQHTVLVLPDVFNVQGVEHPGPVQKTLTRRFDGSCFTGPSAASLAS